jgi:hypothetical protein
MKRSTAKLTIVALAVAAATPVCAAMGGEAPLPPARPAELTPAPAPPPNPALRPALPSGSEGAAPACMAKLTAGGARADVAAAPESNAQGCGIASPIRLTSITLAGGDVVDLPDRPVLDCAFALVFADYVRLIVAPLAAATLGAKVASIETGPGYECRGQNRVAGAKISAHGKGLAVDLVAIVFADKRRVVAQRLASSDEASYFRALRKAACGWFTTVLGPGADAFHANNMHIDTESHGSSGNYRICE